MEIILKKTKITLSVFNQILQAYPIDFLFYETVGFCVVKGVKWIIFCDKTTNSLRKHPAFSVKLSDNTASIEIETRKGKYLYTSEDSKEKRLEIIEIMETIQNKAFEKGQFFM